MAEAGRSRAKPARLTRRADVALTSPAPFVERLTHFWANHFAVSAEKLGVTGMAGLLEFEAIRPNLLGSKPNRPFEA